MTKKYHIIKTDERWQGKLENSLRASVTGESKKEVQEKVFKIAKRYGNSEVYVYNSKGKLSSKRNFKSEL